MSVVGSVAVLLVLAGLFVAIVLITPLIWHSGPGPRVPEDSTGPSVRPPTARREP